MSPGKSDLWCLSGQEELINVFQGLDLNVLDWANTDKLLVVRGEKDFWKYCIYVEFFWLVTPGSILFNLPAVCLKLFVIGVIFSKLSPLVWLWQVLEAQRRHQKEKSGIIPTSPTPYTYNKVGEEIDLYSLRVASFLQGVCGPLGMWLTLFLPLDTPMQKAGSSHTYKRVFGICF